MSHSYLVAVACASGAVVAIGLIALEFVRRRRDPRKHLTVSVEEPPHPGWTCGQKQPGPFLASDLMTLDPAQMTGGQCYPLVISAVVPRPIAFVSTLSLDGVGNLAPFSYFAALSDDPPCISVSICRSARRGGGTKDTAQNILDTKEFVVHIISEWFIESANFTCGPFDPEINELELVNFTPIPSLKVKPPRIEESVIQMECILRHSYDIQSKSGSVHATVFIGEVVMFHVNRGVLTTTASGKVAVDFFKLQPMCRLGGNTYGRVTSIFDLPRPDRIA